MLNASSNLLYQKVILADDIIEIIYEVLFSTCIFTYIVNNYFFLPGPRDQSQNSFQTGQTEPQVIYLKNLVFLSNKFCSGNSNPNS